jgi:hypothetical protein
MTPLRTTFAAAATAAALVTVSVVGSGTAAADRDTRNDSGVRALVAWNQAMVSSLRQAQLPGPPSTRAAAIVGASVFDAVNGVTGIYAPYSETAPAPAHASAAAAAIGAAHEALALQFPTQRADLDALLTQTVGSLRHRGHASVDRGLAWGAKVADDMSASRAADGANATPPPYQATAAPGRWQPTPPLFGPPAFRQFATVVPFTMTSPRQFRPPPPPALTSARYARDFNEVKAYGSLASTARTAYQTESAHLWQTDGPVNLWSPVADRLILARHLHLTQAARLLARMYLAMADAAIAVWDAKNFYDTWRPITAIQQAGTDGNPATVADANWQPLLPSPPFQEYPSGHVGASQAAAGILTHQFGNHTRFEIATPLMPGVVHRFHSFRAGMAELTDARIDVGFHFRFACDAAEAMGREIDAWVLATQMRRVDRDGH